MRNRHVRAAALILAALAPAIAFAATDPDTLARQATIRRDTFGVPHILAQTEEAAAFANGYVVAEDHVLEVARLYLIAKSREARYFGEDFSESDFQMKLYRVYEFAQRGYDASAPWVRDIVDGYAAGFNRYVEQRRNDLPAWVEPMTGVDVIAHSMAVADIEFTFDGDHIEDVTEAAATEDRSTPGSNMFAVNKERSATGHAMLLGNPHLAWFGNQVWHELHITVPGVINVYGASLIGIPGVAIGFNDNLGWSHTVNPSDQTDIYELTLAPGDPESYLFDGKPRKLEKRELIVEVDAGGDLVELTRTAYASHHGPIIAIKGDKAYALKSPNIDNYRMIEQWSLMGKARNLDEFKATLNVQGLPMFNICYGDIEGNCYYVSNGRFPKRPAGYDWEGVVPGDTSKTDWTEILSPEELPTLTNPRGGYVHNANNAPWFTSLAEPMDKTKFPPDVFEDDNDMRAQLGLRMIDADTSLTFNEMLENKLNPLLLAAERMKPPLLAAAKSSGMDDKLLTEAVRVLEKWDNTTAHKSRGAVLFVAFLEAYGEQAEKIFEQDWDPARPMETPYGIGEPELAVKVLAGTAAKVQEDFSALDVPYGDVFRLRQGDVDVPMTGSDDTYGAYRVVYYMPEEDGKMKALGGDSYVFAVEFTSPPRAVSVLPYSQNADPKSPHHADQTALFAEGKFKDVWFTEDAIKKHTERSYHP